LMAQTHKIFLADREGIAKKLDHIASPQ
jgi:hypothetical protein